MGAYRQGTREARSRKARGAYVLIVRGPDGRLRSERFNDVATYRARLAAFNKENSGKHSENGGLSIDEIAGLLDS